MNYLKKHSNIIITVLVVAGLWSLIAYLGIWSPYVFPTPQKVGHAFLLLIESGKLLSHILISLRRIAIGLVISIIIGIPMGVLIGISNKFYHATKPFLEFMRHTPPLALVPMLILWFGIGERSKLIIIILATIFPILLNTLYGVRECEQKLIEVGHSFALSPMKIFARIIWPSTVPHILQGINLSIGYGWRAIIGAEMIAASSGLGYMILDGQQLSRPDVVIVGIITIGTLGMVTEVLFGKIINFFTKWKEIANE